MNKIDCTSSKPNLTFGIAFRPFTNNKGVRTGELLDLHEEIKMYKSITEKLNKDVLVKTENGLKTDNYKIIKEDINNKQAMRYFDKNGEFFFMNDNVQLNNVDEHFKTMRKIFDNIFNK